MIKRVFYVHSLDRLSSSVDPLLWASKMKTQFLRVFLHYACDYSIPIDQRANEMKLGKKKSQLLLEVFPTITRPVASYCCYIRWKWILTDIVIVVVYVILALCESCGNWYHLVLVCSLITCVDDVLQCIKRYRQLLVGTRSSPGGIFNDVALCGRQRFSTVMFTLDLLHHHDDIGTSS